MTATIALATLALAFAAWLYSQRLDQKRKARWEPFSDENRTPEDYRPGQDPRPWACDSFETSWDHGQDGGGRPA